MSSKKQNESIKVYLSLGLLVISNGILMLAVSPYNMSASEAHGSVGFIIIACSYCHMFATGKSTYAPVVLAVWATMIDSDPNKILAGCIGLLLNLLVFYIWFRMFPKVTELDN
jgi:hypothetical protein